MSLHRYSRRTLVRLSALGALPLTLALLPLRVASAPPEFRGEATRQMDVPQVPGDLNPLLPIKRDPKQARRLAAREGLNWGGNVGPRAAIQAVARLEREGTGAGTFVVKDDKKHWRIEILGISHIEPGRSRSWRLDGTPLPKLLPFGATTGIPVAGDFERQIAIRVSETGIRGVTGFFDSGKPGELPSHGDPANTMPVPRRLHGDRVIVIQQGFPKEARTGKFWLKYYLEPEPLKTLSARNGKVLTDPARWDARLLSGQEFASGKKSFAPAPTQADTVLCLRKPEHLDGTLRVMVQLKNGKGTSARSFGQWNPEISFAKHPDLANYSNWLLSGVRREDVARIYLSVAKGGMFGINGLALHPKA